MKGSGGRLTPFFGAKPLAGLRLDATALIRRSAKIRPADARRFMMFTSGKNLSAALVVLATACGTVRMAVAQEDAHQQQPALESAAPAQFHRTVILKTPLQGVEGKEMLAWVAELAPGASIAMHTHPYDEFVYVVEGSVTMELEEQAPRTLRSGEIAQVPANTVHGARNTSEVFPARSLVFGLTIEGKPLAVPVK